MTQDATTLLDRLERYAGARPREPAMIFPVEGTQLTWGDLRSSALRLAGALHGGGASSGDRILILTSSPREEILAFLGVLALGACPSILSYPSVKQSESAFTTLLKEIVEGCEPRCVMVAPGFAGLVRSVRAQAPSPLGVLSLDDTTLGSTKTLATHMRRRPDEMMFLQFSSGTTGLRKSVSITSEMFIAQAEACHGAVGFTSDDRIISWLPLYHDMGLLASFLIPTYHGVPSVHVAPFDWLRHPASLFLDISRYRGTLAWLPNFAYALCTDRIALEDLRRARVDLSSLRGLINCSEPVHRDTHQRFLETFAEFGLRASHLQACYAMAENTFAVAQTRLGSAVRNDEILRSDFHAGNRAVPAGDAAAGAETMIAVSCGPPVPGTEVRIAGAETARIVGEIEIRGTSLFAGYWAQRDQDQGSVDPEGWFRTGDLGYLADGELFVVGRRKDLVIHQGRNLHPDAIETAFGAIPGCKSGRVVVFGIDGAGTEEVVVMYEADGSSSATAVSQAIRLEALGRFGFNPIDIVQCPPGTLKKSTSGKLSRTANRASYRSTRATRAGNAEDTPIVASPRSTAPVVRVRANGAGAAEGTLEELLTRLWAEVLGIPVSAVAMETSLYLQLGATSLHAMSVASRLEQSLERKVDVAIFRDDSIRGQAHLLRRDDRAARPEARSLVRLRKGSDARLPLFLFPVAQGLWAYSDLVGQLEDRTVYGVADASLHCCIEHTAAHYIEMIEEVAKGPYLLGGKCFGGTVAFEMARQLTQACKPVAAVVLISVVPPHASRLGALLEAVCAQAVVSSIIRCPRLARCVPGVRRLFRPENVLERLLVAGPHFASSARDLLPILEFVFGASGRRVLEQHPQAIETMTAQDAWAIVHRELFSTLHHEDADDRFFPPGTTAEQTLELVVRQTHNYTIQHYGYVPKTRCDVAPILVASDSRRWARWFSLPARTLGPRLRGSPLHAANVSTYVGELNRMLEESDRASGAR
jgi:acyl-CoA synthetase (AMP-forming)/AMP-acid ligase II